MSKRFVINWTIRKAQSPNFRGLLGKWIINRRILKLGFSIWPWNVSFIVTSRKEIPAGLLPHKIIQKWKTKIQKSEAFTVNPHESVLQIFSPVEISAFMTSQKYLGLLEAISVIARESKKSNTSHYNFLTREKQHISSSTFTTWPRVSHAAAAVVVAFSQKTTLIVLQNFYKSPGPQLVNNGIR